MRKRIIDAIIETYNNSQETKVKNDYVFASQQSQSTNTVSSCRSKTLEICLVNLISIVTILFLSFSTVLTI